MTNTGYPTFLPEPTQTTDSVPGHFIIICRSTQIPVLKGSAMALKNIHFLGSRFIFLAASIVFLFFLVKGLAIQIQHREVTFLWPWLLSHLTPGWLPRNHFFISFSFLPTLHLYPSLETWNYFRRPTSATC